jgi:predicted lysophospholipase L1 biosynthesis ABC-type transport system permease subunit
MARRFWPGEDPIGQRVSFIGRAGERPRTVVGVVRNMTQVLGAMEPRPVVYTSYAQQPETAVFPQTTFVIRGLRDPLSLVTAVRYAVAELDPNRPITNITSLAWWSNRGMINRSFYTLVLLSFAAIATLLACMSVYGVTAYAVSQRTREIGIRLALGAQLSQIRRLVGARAAVLIAIGIVSGSGCAFALTRFLSFLLNDVSPYDPWIFSAAIAVLALVGLVACIPPTRRAERIDPVAALRCE